MSEEASYSRKGFFREFFSHFKKGVANHVDRKLGRVLAAPLRPPGALDEVEFLSACTRCNDCVEVCPYHALRRLPAQAGVAANTPYIEPRTQACMLCEDFPCIAACDHGALLPVRPEDVRMGRAKVDVAACRTYDDQVCTHCYDACPYPERAIEIGADFHPKVLDGCVGCGLCEARCPVTPVGIRTLSPTRYRSDVIENDMYFGIWRREEEDPKPLETASEREDKSVS